MIPLLLLVLVVAVIVVASRRKRRGGAALRPGPGTMGTVYDFLNEDKRNAIELIVEERAEARDPEDAEGNLPELEDPKRL
jgi:hypothetical protein